MSHAAADLRASSSEMFWTHDEEQNSSHQHEKYSHDLINLEWISWKFGLNEELEKIHCFMSNQSFFRLLKKENDVFLILFIVYSAANMLFLVSCFFFAQFDKIKFFYGNTWLENILFFKTQNKIDLKSRRTFFTNDLWFLMLETFHSQSLKIISLKI